MRGGILSAWVGITITYVVLTLSAFSTTFDVDVVLGASTGLAVAERVDQGPLSRMLSPALGTLGALRFTKRNWGLGATYTQELTVTAARLAQQAGAPISVSVTLAIPGTVVGTNATGRDNRTLVWSEIPADAPLWARTRTINWPAVFLAAAALAATAWAWGR